MKTYFLWLAALLIVLTGCDESASYRAQQQRDKWAREDEDKRVAAKCGEKPEFNQREEWEVTLRIVGKDVTFPYSQRFRPSINEVVPLPQFVYETVLWTNDRRETFFSVDRPKQASDGLYELFDLKSGEKKVVAPNVTISLARVEEGVIDPVSASLRSKALEFAKAKEAWQKCAGYSNTPQW